MTTQIAKPSRLAQAVRVLLTFLLVFGMSFRVEMAIAVPDECDVDDHKGEMLTNLSVAQVAGDGDEIEIDENGELVNPVKSLVDMRDDEDGEGEPVTLEFGETVYFAAVPEWDGRYEGEAANFVEWEVDGEELTDPVIDIQNENVGEEDEVIKVTCILDVGKFDDAAAEEDGEAAEDKDAEKESGATIDERLEGADEITFTVTLKPEEKKDPQIISKVISIDCLLAGKKLEKGGNKLELTLDETKDYRFEAEVSAIISALDEDGEKQGEDKTLTYSSVKDEATPLSEASKSFNEADGDTALLKDLTWSLLKTEKNGGGELEESVAVIDEKGVLTVNEDNCEFVVQCLASSVDNERSAQPQVAVVVGSPDPTPTPGPDEPEIKPDPDRHSDTLAVSGYIASSAVEGGEEVDTGGEKSESASNGSSSSSSSSESSSSSKASYVKLDDEFSYEGDFGENGHFHQEGLYREQETRQMFSSTNGQVDITGEGVLLTDLLSALSPSIIDFSAIDEIQFADDSGSAVTLKWKDIVSEKDGPFVAVQSYVSAIDSKSDSENAGGADGESADGKDADGKAADDNGADDKSADDKAADDKAADDPKTPEMSPNTRFRVLFDDAADSAASAIADADSLRYISKIVINPSLAPEPEPEPEPEPTPDPKPDAPFTVSIAYAPAPIGQRAVFNPILSEEVGGATFDFSWWESSDEGATWSKKPISTDQTLRVITTKENIGHLYKVTVASEKKDKETGQTVKYKDAESKPVEMIEGEGFIVQLEYDPPFAGDMASFRTNIIDTEGNVDRTKLKYTWQLTTDGGKTWVNLADEYQGMSTLSIQTSPIDDSDAWQEDTELTYIRVVVEETTGQQRKSISNAQLLTVKTGKKEGEPQPIDIPKPKPAPTVTDPVVDPDDLDDEPKPASADEEETMGDEPADDAPQLYIDEAVTQQILDQEQSEQEYIESTVPGARWTSLSKSGDEGDDRNVLSDNPFAPFAIPIGLGITAAGGLEKLLLFRRQL